MSVTLRPLEPGDLEFANSIRADEGWNQTRADWESLLDYEEAECFLAAREGEPAGTVSVIHYGASLSWIGMLLVAKRFRGSGIGTLLLEHAIQSAQARGARCVGLDATPAGRPLYEKRGFVMVSELRRWEGIAPSHPRAGAVIPIADADWPGISKLDQRAFGCDRLAWLRRLSLRGRHMVLAEAGRLDGFGMIRPGERAWYLGPVLASEESAAVRIVNGLLSKIPGEPVYWDAFSPVQDDAPALPARFGFAVQRPLYRMLLGEPLTQERGRLIAIADPASG